MKRLKSSEKETEELDTDTDIDDIDDIDKHRHIHIHTHIHDRRFPDGSDDIESACNAGIPGCIPGLGRSPGKGNGYPLQCSCLKNPMDRGP